MAILKCKMCGGDLEINEGITITECDYCGTKQTVPTAKDENLHGLYNRANNLRIKSEFDKAEQLYEKILQSDEEQSEAYWGLILCKYGIEYVEDPKTFKRIPTCHRASFDSIIADEDYKSALKYADCLQKDIYEQEAKEIDRIQKEILELSQKEKPYDVFICYKETDATGNRTPDSVIANDIYYQLTNEGFKVFYAAISLEDKLGLAYEPCIFAALNSAKVMLAIGTRPEYFNAVWVKNEWSRYLKIMKNDRSKLLIPCFKDMDAYDLPDEFAHLQAQDMGKIGFINDVVRGIKKVVVKDEPAPQVTTVKETVVTNANTNIAPLLKRISIFLEDGNFESADEYCEKVLDIDPECASAYFYKMLSEFKFKGSEELINNATEFTNNANFKKAMRFADDTYRKELESILDGVKENKRKKEEERKQREEAERKRIEQEQQKRREEAERKQREEAERRRLEEEKLKQKAIELELKRKRLASVSQLISAGDNCTMILNLNGTVTAVGENFADQCNVSLWQDIVSVAVGCYHTIGVKSNGTLIAEGHNGFEQCSVSSFEDIISVAAGDSHTVGLKSDNTVIAIGDNSKRQCSVSDWQNIKTITAGNFHTIGVKTDGMVVAVGKNENGQCNVSGWRDIVSAAAGDLHTVGLKANGTVVAVGDNANGQCNVSNWNNIVSISAAGYHTVGLKADGTVVATGFNEDGQCNVSNWHNIVAIATGSWHTVGLKSDGTIVVVGSKRSGRDSVSNFKLFDNIDNLEEERKDAIAKSALYRNNGVCQHCGGAFKGLFSKKCSSCGKEKDY